MHVKRKVDVRDTRDGADIADDRCDDRMVSVETFGRLEVGRIQILGTMRKEVKPCPTFKSVRRPPAYAKLTHQP